MGLKKHSKLKSMFRIKLSKNGCVMSLVGVFVLFIIQGCQMKSCGSSADDLLDKVERLVVDVKKMEYPSDDPRWESYDQRFEKYYEECYDQWVADMTGEQKKEFAGLTARYLANRLGKPIFKSLFNKFNRWTREDEEMEELADKFGRDLQNFIEDTGSEGNRLLRDLYRDAREWLESEKRKKLD